MHVGHETVALGIVRGSAHKQLVFNDRSVDDTADIPGIEVSILHGALGVKVRFRFLGNNVDRTTRGVSAIKCTLRSAQDFDSFDILQLWIQGAVDIVVICPCWTVGNIEFVYIDCKRACQAANKGNC